MRGQSIITQLIIGYTNIIQHCRYTDTISEFFKFLKRFETEIDGFSAERFREGLRAYVNESIAEYKSSAVGYVPASKFSTEGG